MYQKDKWPIICVLVLYHNDTWPITSILVLYENDTWCIISVLMLYQNDKTAQRHSVCIYNIEIQLREIIMLPKDRKGIHNKWL